MGMIACFSPLSDSKTYLTGEMHLKTSKNRHFDVFWMFFMTSENIQKSTFCCFMDVFHTSETIHKMTNVVLWMFAQ